MRVRLQSSWRTPATKARHGLVAKGENMNRIVSFKSITQMEARKIAVDWLVARCKELKIVVPATIKSLGCSLQRRLRFFFARIREVVGMRVPLLGPYRVLRFVCR